MSPCEIVSSFGIFLVLVILVVLGALAVLLLRDEKQFRQLSQQLRQVSQQLHAEAEEIKKILAYQGRILAQQGRAARKAFWFSVAALVLTAISLVFQVKSTMGQNGADDPPPPAASNGAEGLADVLGEINQTLENIDGTLRGSKDAVEKPAANAVGLKADLSGLLAEMKTLNRCVMQITKDIGGMRKALEKNRAAQTPQAESAAASAR